MARAGRHLAHDVGRINSLILDTDGARNKHPMLTDLQNYEECSKKYFIVIVDFYSHLLIRIHETNVWSIPVFLHGLWGLLHRLTMVQGLVSCCTRIL